MINVKNLYDLQDQKKMKYYKCVSAAERLIAMKIIRMRYLCLLKNKGMVRLRQIALK